MPSNPASVFTPPSAGSPPSAPGGVFTPGASGSGMRVTGTLTDGSAGVVFPPLFAAGEFNGFPSYTSDGLAVDAARTADYYVACMGGSPEWILGKYDAGDVAEALWLSGDSTSATPDLVTSWFASVGTGTPAVSPFPSAPGAVFTPPASGVSEVTSVRFTKPSPGAADSGELIPVTGGSVTIAFSSDGNESAPAEGEWWTAQWTGSDQWEVFKYINDSYNNSWYSDEGFEGDPYDATWADGMALTVTRSGGVSAPPAVFTP